MFSVQQHKLRTHHRLSSPAPDLKRLFPKMVGFSPKSSILIRFSIIFTSHFGGTPYFFGNPSNHQVILAILVLPAWKWYILPGLHSPPQSTTSSAVASTMGSSIGVHAAVVSFGGWGKRGWLFGKGERPCAWNVFFFPPIFVEVIIQNAFGGLRCFFLQFFSGSEDSECVSEVIFRKTKLAIPTMDLPLQSRYPKHPSFIGCFN